MWWPVQSATVGRVTRTVPARRRLGACREHRVELDVVVLDASVTLDVTSGNGGWATLRKKD